MGLIDRKDLGFSSEGRRVIKDSKAALSRLTSNTRLLLQVGLLAAGVGVALFITPSCIQGVNKFITDSHSGISSDQLVVTATPRPRRPTSTPARARLPFAPSEPSPTLIPSPYATQAPKAEPTRVLPTLVPNTPVPRPIPTEVITLDWTKITEEMLTGDDSLIPGNIFRHTNDVRSIVGLYPYQNNNLLLCELAREVAEGYIRRYDRTNNPQAEPARDHDIFAEVRQSYVDQKKVGPEFIAQTSENWAFGYSSSRATVIALLRSPKGHRENLLNNDLTQMCVAVSRPSSLNGLRFIVQDFSLR